MSSTPPAPTSDRAAGSPPRSRRSIPLSLRMFAAVLLLLGGASAFWVGIPSYRQHIALGEIERLGGKTKLVPVGPRWLRSIVGNNRMRVFDQVKMVYLLESEATDDTLASVGRLRDVEELFLSRTRVTDAGLVHLQGLTNLKKLWLDDTQVTDVSLQRLKGLARLEHLCLGGTLITDEGLVYLNGMPNLFELSLTRTKVTDAGLVHLRKVGLTQGLGILNLDDTSVTDAGVADLKRLASQLSISHESRRKAPDSATTD